MWFEPLEQRQLLAAMPPIAQAQASMDLQGTEGDADTAAEILVADRLSNSVYRYSTSGSFLGILVDHDNTHLSQPAGIQVSPDGTKLYVSSSQTNSVVVYDYDYSAATATYSQTITQNLSFPNSILFNAAGDKFYVSNFAFDIVDDVPVPVGVSQFNADGTSAGANIVGGSILQTTGLQWASDDELIVGGYNGLVAKSSGGVSALADYINPTPALSGASGVLRIGTDLYVSAMFVPAIYKYDITGAPAVVSSFTINTLPFPETLIAAPDGNGLLVGVLGNIAGTGNISRIGFNGALDPITVFAPSGNGITAFQEATAMVVVSEPASVATVTGRRLFYNNSIWDDPGFGFTNASAIAGDKTAYVPNGANTTSFANMSSYTKGINGIMVEIASAENTLTAADFTVKMSGQNLAANNTPSTWTAAPSFTVTRIADTPSAGTDRYELVWADGAITNRYLYVVVEGNDALGGNNTNTGLAASDYFFFGNKIGDVGSPEFYPNVNATDQVQVRNNQGVLAPPSGVLNLFDFNRDALVDATDQIIARNNQGAMPWLDLTAPPSAPQAAGADGDGSAVASALAAPSASTQTAPGATVRTDAAATLESSDRASIGSFWQHVAAANDPRANAILGSLGEAGESPALDEWLEDVLRLKR
jgi:hypothetical protein